MFRTKGLGGPRARPFFALEIVRGIEAAAARKGSLIKMKLEIDAIRAAAERVAKSHGLDLVDVEFAGAGKMRALRVFVEKDAAGREALKTQAIAEDSGFPSGVPVEALSGVTHEDCATFAVDFGTLLDVEDLIPGSAEYTLEVSSPGIERKLVRPSDWERFQGFIVAAKLFTAVNGVKLLTGRMTFADGIATFDPSAVKQKGKRKKGVEPPPAEKVTVPLSEIEKANLVAEI
jgi:ribosome maturation factor RimP